MLLDGYLWGRDWYFGWDAIVEVEGGKCSRKMQQVGVVADRAVAMVGCCFDGSCCPELLVVAIMLLDG